CHVTNPTTSVKPKANEFASICRGTMADQNQQLEQLKQKYASVLNMIQQSGVRLSHVHVQDNKLFIQGEAPSQDVKNKVWNQIKLVDPTYSDLTADISVAAGGQTEGQQVTQA